MKYSLGFYKIRLFSEFWSLGNIKGKDILELGAGSGGFARFFLECGAKVSGIEISEKEFKESLSSIKDDNFTLLFGDARTIDLNKIKPFDILVNDLFMPPRESIEITSRLASKLKDGGFVIHVLKRDKINMGNYEIIYNLTKDALRLVEIIRPPTGNIETYFIFKKGKTGYGDYLSKVSKFIKNMLDAMLYIEELKAGKGTAFNFSFEHMSRKEEVSKKICPFVTSEKLEYISFLPGKTFMLHTSSGNRFFDIDE